MASFDDSETRDGAENNTVAQMIAETMLSEPEESVRDDVRPMKDDVSSRAMTDQRENKFVNQHNAVAQNDCCRDVL